MAPAGRLDPIAVGRSVKALSVRLDSASNGASDSSLDELVPLAKILATAQQSPRHRKKPRDPEWSACYRTTCLAMALLVALLPIMLIFGVLFFVVLPGGDDDASTGAAPAAAVAATAGSVVLRACARDSPAAVNASLYATTALGTSAPPIAIALILDEGPRGEYRRRAREALAVARARALAGGLRVFSFEPCALPPNSAALLAGASAAAACRVGRALAEQRHGCSLGGYPCVAPPATSHHRDLGSSGSSSPRSSGGGGGGSGHPSSSVSGGGSSRSSSSKGGAGGGSSPPPPLPPEACAAQAHDDPPVDNVTVAPLDIAGCCAATGGRGSARGAKLKLGRGLKGLPKRRKQQQKLRRRLLE